MRGRRRALDSDRAEEAHGNPALLAGDALGHAVRARARDRPRRGGRGRPHIPGAFSAPERALLESVTTSIALALERLWVLEERQRLIERLKDSFMGTAEALANALEAKDDYTANHAQEIAGLAVAVGRRMGMAGDELDDLRYGAVFHDIGKIAVPDAILRKPGRAHRRGARGDRAPRRGRRPDHLPRPVPRRRRPDRPPRPRALGRRRLSRRARGQADPPRRPHRLRRRRLPRDGLDRPYREGMSESEAVTELRRHAGTQFDPEVVDAFLAVHSGRP